MLERAWGLRALELSPKSIVPKWIIQRLSFSYQAIIGVTFDISEQLAINTDYRYFQTEKLNYVNKSIRNHPINIGLIYYF